MANQTHLTKVYVSGLLFNVSYLTFAVLIPLDALHQHLPVWILGALAAIPGVLQLPTRIMSGPLVDLKGERWVLWVTYSLAVLAAVAASGGKVLPIVALVVGQLLVGAARGFFWTAAQSEVASAAGNRAQHMGLFTVYTKGGALIGIAAAGSLAELIGLTGAFAFSGLLAFIALILGLMLPHRPLLHRPKTLWSAVARLSPATRQPFVVVNGLIAFLCAVPQALGQSFYPVVLIRLGLAESLASLLTALMSLGMVLSGMVGARFLARWGMKGFVAAAMALVAGALAGTAYGNWLLDGVLIFAGGFGAGWLNVAFLTAVSGHSQDGERGTNLAATQVYFVVAMMATPLLCGWLYAMGGQALTFLVIGGMTLVVAMSVWRLWPWQEGGQAASVGSTLGSS